MSKVLTMLLMAGTCVTAFAQHNAGDSLRTLLSRTTKPAERFNIIVKFLEYEDNFQATTIDSSDCAELLKIAQQQQNEGMLATSYNWIGYYLYFTKGDNTAALEYYFKALPLAEKSKDKRRISSLCFDIASTYALLENSDESYKYIVRGGNNLPEKSSPMYNHMLVQYQRGMTIHFTDKNILDSALYYGLAFEQTSYRSHAIIFKYQARVMNGYIHSKLGEQELAEIYFKTSMNMLDSIKGDARKSFFYKRYVPFLISVKRIEDAKVQTERLWEVAKKTNNLNVQLLAATLKRQLFDKLKQTDSAYYYSRVEADTKDQIFNQNNQNIIQALAFKEQLRGIEDEEKNAAFQNQLTEYVLLAGLCSFLIVALLLYRNNLSRKKANQLLQKQKSEIELQHENVERTLTELKLTQSQLVQSEKMASLGELTAGIAHEIQNPLNFVNNFSEVNSELIAEMKAEIDKGNLNDAKTIANSIDENEQKIIFHGKRADAIVKGMLQHSRSSSGVKEATDINALADEYLRLAYHGLRAKDKSFNATTKTEFDATISKINVVSQEIGRVILNLITNAFFAVSDKKALVSTVFEPTVTVSTRNLGDKVEIRVRDNGNGIPQKVIDKIFQPFFTTKPTGQGTGLGLSLSYDIVKAHGGQLKVQTKEGEFAEFVVLLPKES